MPVPSSPPYVHRRVVSVTELPVFAKLERFDRDNSDAVPSHNPDLLSRGRSQEPDHTNSVPSARPVYTTKYEHGRYTVGVEAYLNDTGGGGGVASGHHMHRKTSLPTMGGGVYRASRDRTRVSAVQRLVERKLAQKEKEREKERDRSWTSFNSYTSSNSSSRPRAPNNCSTQSTSYLFGVGGHRSRRDDHSPTGSTFSDAVPRSPGRDCSRGSKSENGFILGAGRCSSPSKENVEPDDWPYAGDNGNTCRSRRRTARSVSGSRLGRFLNNDDDEATVKTYITIGPGKPTRIREHSPAKSAKLSTDETVTSARARTANSTATSHHHSGRSSFSGSTAFSTLREFDLNRQRSPSPHRKTSCHSFFYTSSSDCNNNINSSHFDGQGLGPAVSKVKDSILRDASPLKSTDILKTFRAFKSESNLNAGGNSLPPLHPGVSATRTSCRVIIEETTSSTPDQESRPTAHCGSRRPGRRLSVDIVNSSRGAAVSREGSTASSSSGVSSGSSRVSGSDTKRASPESDLASSVFSTPLSGSSDSVDTSASTLSGDSSGVVGERGPTHLSQRRISLEQRFQARFASPERTVFTGGIGTNGTASATTTSSRLFAEGNRTVFSESSVGPDGTQSQRIRVSGTVRTSCEFSRVSGGSASSRTSWEFVRCGGEGDSNSGAQVAHEEPRVDTTGAQPNHKGFFQGDEELDESYRSTNGQRQSRETRRRPVPALRKISLPQTASYQSQRPEPAPRRKSLTSIVSVESPRTILDMSYGYKSASKGGGRAGDRYAGQHYSDAKIDYSKTVGYRGDGYNTNLFACYDQGGQEFGDLSGSTGLHDDNLRTNDYLMKGSVDSHRNFNDDPKQRSDPATDTLVQRLPFKEDNVASFSRKLSTAGKQNLSEEPSPRLNNKHLDLDATPVNQRRYRKRSDFENLKNQMHHHRHIQRTLSFSSSSDESVRSCGTTVHQDDNSCWIRSPSEKANDNLDLNGLLKARVERSTEPPTRTIPPQGDGHQGGVPGGSCDFYTAHVKPVISSSKAKELGKRVEPDLPIHPNLSTNNKTDGDVAQNQPAAKMPVCRQVSNDSASVCSIKPPVDLRERFSRGRTTSTVNDNGYEAQSEMEDDSQSVSTVSGSGIDFFRKFVRRKGGRESGRTTADGGSSCKDCEDQFRREVLIERLVSDSISSKAALLSGLLKEARLSESASAQEHNCPSRKSSLQRHKNSIASASGNASATYQVGLVDDQMNHRCKSHQVSDNATKQKRSSFSKGEAHDNMSHSSRADSCSCASSSSAASVSGTGLLFLRNYLRRKKMSLGSQNGSVNNKDSKVNKAENISFFNSTPLPFPPPTDYYGPAFVSNVSSGDPDEGSPPSSTASRRLSLCSTVADLLNEDFDCDDSELQILDWDDLADDPYILQDDISTYSDLVSVISESLHSNSISANDCQSNDKLCDKEAESPACEWGEESEDEDEGRKTVVATERERQLASESEYLDYEEEEDEEVAAAVARSDPIHTPDESALDRDQNRNHSANISTGKSSLTHGRHDSGTHSGSYNKASTTFLQDLEAELTLPPMSPVSDEKEEAVKAISRTIGKYMRTRSDTCYDYNSTLKCTCGCSCGCTPDAHSYPSSALSNLAGQSAFHRSFDAGSNAGECPPAMTATPEGAGFFNSRASLDKDRPSSCNSWSEVSDGLPDLTESKPVHQQPYSARCYVQNAPSKTANIKTRPLGELLLGDVSSGADFEPYCTEKATFREEKIKPEIGEKVSFSFDKPSSANKSASSGLTVEEISNILSLPDYDTSVNVHEDCNLNSLGKTDKGLGDAHLLESDSNASRLTVPNAWIKIDRDSPDYGTAYNLSPCPDLADLIHPSPDRVVIVPSEADSSVHHTCYDRSDNMQMDNRKTTVNSHGLSPYSPLPMSPVASPRTINKIDQVMNSNRTKLTNFWDNANNHSPSSLDRINIQCNMPMGCSSNSGSGVVLRNNALTKCSSSFHPVRPSSYGSDGSSGGGINSQFSSAQDIAGSTDRIAHFIDATRRAAALTSDAPFSPGQENNRKYAQNRISYGSDCSSLSGMESSSPHSPHITDEMNRRRSLALKSSKDAFPEYFV